jgi:rod shape-determining protein MreD
MPFHWPTQPLMTRSRRTQEILRPASGKFIAFTLVCALLLNLLPWSGIGLTLRPDFVALALLYWCIHQPRKLNMGSAWFMGLLIDVADGALLGQHALAYTIMVFTAIMLHRRILMFPLWQQALHVFPLLLLLQMVTLLIKLMAGSAFSGWSLFLSAIGGALVWPLLALLQLPQRRHPKSEGKVSAPLSR